MKDLEWLKERVKEYNESLKPSYQVYSTDYRAGFNESTEVFLELIDQVEQPNQSNSMGLELPVIPDYVAEYILNEKEGGFSLKQSLNNASDYALQSMGIVKKTADYLDESHENFEKYVKSYLFGYTVEVKKYYVLDKKNMIPLLVMEKGKVGRAHTHLAIGVHHREESVFQLTEQEIKGYDPRYMAFAKEVKE